MWQMVLLGAVQGLTEFLPISSSGHLVLVSQLFDVEASRLDITIWLHSGTLAATCVVYRREITGILRGDWKLALTLGIALLPAAVVGLACRDLVRDVFSNLTAVGFLFWLTAGCLFGGEWLFRLSPIEREHVRPKDALIIGIAQAAALLPGTSRSGMTIAAGLACGIRREAAARFSFLLSIPTILGSVLTSLLVEGHEAAGQPDLLAALAGVVTSFLVGWIALCGLIALLRRYPMHIFAIYCLLLGAGVLASQFAGSV